MTFLFGLKDKTFALNVQDYLFHFNIFLLKRAFVQACNNGIVLTFITIIMFGGPGAYEVCKLSFDV